VNETEVRTQSPHHRIVRLRVVGGFLSGAQLEFADGLNCFIGGRGAGKTTALEFLRFGLGLMPDPKVNLQRSRALESLVKANLGAGKVSIDIQTKSDMAYTASRSGSETVQVVNESGVAVPITLDRDLIFSADVFSQNEIEEIASNPSSQLLLLDRFLEDESSSIAKEVEHLYRKIEQSSIDLNRMDQEIDDLSTKVSELPAIEEKLKGLAEVGGPDADKINAAHAAKAMRTREQQVPQALIAAIQRAARDLASVSAALQATNESHLDTIAGDGPNGEVLAAIRAEAQAFEQSVVTAAEAISIAAREAATKIDHRTAPLAELHAAQELAYRELVSASEQQGGRAKERVSLQSAQASALSAQKEQQAREKQREVHRSERARLVGRLSELRDQRFELRKRVAERLSHQFPVIRVTVVQAAELDRYTELVAECLKGIGIKHAVTAERLAQLFLPTELARVIATSNYGALVERAGFDEMRARKIVEALRGAGRGYQLETVELDDRPCIELHDGSTYKESGKLSTGQRCTTILPILLVQSERPLLIDQPEDNLDNAFVYDTIVKALREVKGGRQVIFVTHNPNIPVLGEAERVFVFESDGRRADLRQVGTVDECKDHIERILEGGRDAFLQRKTRYGH
jgi:AAA domain